MTIDRTLRVALLIDADNLSDDVIEQAIEHLLKNHGAIHFRRAYCSPQKVIEHMDLFRRHAIRPMVNVPTGKNSTDIALAVDAIDLALSERPDLVVIGSSDSDYAPLAQRLREKGCRVLGIGQAGKTGSDSPLAYDGFVDLAHRRVRGDVAQAPAAARTVAVEPPPRARAGGESAARSAAPDAAPRPRKRASPRVTATSAPSLPPAISGILDAVPSLRSGQSVQLNDVGDALRRHELIKSKSVSPSRFLKRHADFFELTPSDKPRTVRFTGPAER